MTALSGSPLYHYTLAKEIVKQGHSVDFYSEWSWNVMRGDLEEVGVNILDEYPIGKYDRIIISQKDHQDILRKVSAKKITNIIHSEYDAETPITEFQIDEYIAIRPSIKEHLIKSHGISEKKIRVVYNGIDFERFSEKKRLDPPEEYTKVVLPCTMDMLRKPFIEYYTHRASERFRVFIFGKDFGNDIFRNEWTFVNGEVNDIENHIADADFIAGILLGRVNLEARAMEIPSFIHNPSDPEEKYVFFPDDETFRENHDITNVTQKILC